MFFVKNTSIFINKPAMKNLLYLLGLFLTVAFTTVEFTKKSTHVVVENDSEVSISGNTNINSFNCCYNINKLDNPIPVHFESRNKNMVFDATYLELENECFDCGNKGINKDFNKLLKTEIYPKIKLKLKEIQKGTTKDESLTALVEISIANKINTYKIPVSVDQEQKLYVEGELRLKLEDFQLEPPKKALGLIVVKDEIKVIFKLNLKQV